MAAYFHGNPPEISSGSDGGLQTLVLMNPASYVQFPDHQPNNNSNLVFLNSHAPPPTTTQQFVGIPLSNTNPPDPTAAADNISIPALHGFVPQRLHYNLYNSHQGVPTACDTTRASQQGLSLTLSSQQQQHRPLGFGSGDEIRLGSGSTGSAVTNGISALLGSKYLKAAQELLDEVVNVNNHFNSNNSTNNNKGEISKKDTGTNKAIGEFSTGDGSVGGEAVAGNRAAELTTAERQEIQMKKAKLISMLDEVEQRYRQYHRQMQVVVSSFEQAAGIGSAKTYTSLALKTISKQFRWLKDAITGQIRTANKSLGEEDSSAGKMEGSRLKFVDHHLRQQRALQQLGMVQHHTNAWRPQRGLPERAVSVLRAWLFEHFLHPYPKDSDKHMLAKQTGLTRGQVSNWFINARVRLWKPMVEEMYIEEMKEREKNTASFDKNGQNNEDSASKSTGNQDKSPVTENHILNNQNTSSISISTAASTSPIAGNVRNQTGFSLIGSSELDGITQGSPKKPRTNSEMMQSPMINMDFNANEKILEERQSRDGYSFIGNPNNNFMGNFGQYPIGEIPRFDAEQFAPRFSGNNGVSLTLGLPHCENLPGTHQSFLPNQNIQLGRRLEMAEPDEFGAMNQSSTPHSSSSAYDSINIQNQRRFVAQLLPDFVT